MKKIIFLLFLLFSSFIFSEEIPVRYYSFKDGLPSLEVWKIYQTRDGYMWFGTSAGLYRYSGNDVRIFRTEDGLPNNVIFALAQDGRGRFWVGTENGCGYFEKWNFIKIEGLSGRKINDILCDGSGGVWVATNNGLFLYNRGNLKKIDLKGEVSFFSLFRDLEGNIWVGGAKRIFKIRGNNITDITKKYDLPEMRVYSIFFDKPNNKILFGSTIGLYILDLKRDGCYRDKTFGDTNFSCITYDKKRDLFWYALWGKGLVRFRDKKDYKLFREKNGIMDPFITDLFLDREGNLWFSMRFGGVGKISFVNDFLYTSEDGIPKGTITAISEDGSGNLWVGSITDGVSKINLSNGKITHFTVKDGLFENEVKKIVIDSSGKVWVFGPRGISFFSEGGFKKVFVKGVKIKYIEPEILYEDSIGRKLITTHYGLIVFKGGKIKLLNERDGLKSTYILSIGEDGKGNVLIGTRSGLFILDVNGKIRGITENEGLISRYVVDIYRDSKGVIYISTNNGLSVLKENIFRNFSTGNGLVGNNISFVREDSSGRIWIATTSGISIYENGKFKNLNLKNGLCSNSINEIFEDTRKRIWIGTSYGINLYDNNKLININEKYDFPNNNVNSIKEDRLGNIFFFCNSYILKFDGYTFHYIDLEDVFKNEVSFTTCWYLDSIRNIWVGTNKGLIRHKITSSDKNYLFPTTFITRIVMNGKEYIFEKSSASIDFVGKVKKITFFWRNNSFFDEEKNVYKFMLEGLDKEWNMDIKRNYATYTNLDPGIYKFRVISRVNCDTFGNIAYVNIRVKGISPFKMKLATIFLLLSLFMGLIFLILNNRKLRKGFFNVNKLLHSAKLRNEMLLIKFNQIKKDFIKFKKVDEISLLYRFPHFLKIFREKFLSQDEKFYFLLFNIENFTYINYSYSIYTADSILSEVGRKIYSQNLIASRLCGDFFAVILEDKEVANRIFEDIEFEKFLPPLNLSIKLYGVCVEASKEKFSSPEVVITFAFRELRRLRKSKVERKKLIFK